jgi:hypothetical protein
MSRSYKKTPIYKDKAKGMKVIANRIVRKQKEIPKGMGYKKIVDSWNISDYKFRDTLKEFLDRQESYVMRRYGRELTKEEKRRYTNDWYKWYKRK